LIGLSLSITSYIASLPFFAQQAVAGDTHTMLVAVIPLAFEWTAFMLLYTVVPNCPVRLRHAVIGAVVATLLFEISKRTFGAFVVSVPTYRVIYGAVAALPVFLIWIYVSWLVTLLGAQITACLPSWRTASRSVMSTKAGTGSARTRK
jgi:membrane protein